MLEREAPGSGDAAGRQARLVDNLAALFAADLNLAKSLDALADSELPQLTPTRTAQPTCCISEPPGQRVWLHSRHDPADEARRLIGSQDLSGKVCFAVHGSGLGYHVRELLDRVPADAMVLLFEPNLPLLRRMLECVDLARPLKCRRLTVITSSEKSALFAGIANRAVLLSMGLATITHPPSERLAGASTFHDRCRQNLKDLAAYSRTSLNTVVINGRRTAENITRNLLRYARSAARDAVEGIASLEGAYAGQPAIVVSAGPSLRKNKHLLKDAKGRAVLVAVQTALKPLLELGVEPDFVTSLDYHDISARFFEGLPAGVRSHLIAEPKATRRVLDLHPGPVSFVGNDYADSLLRDFPHRIPRLPAGATVAHLAFYLARHLGCDPILFVGQDLGFSDGLAYLPGTAYDEVWKPELSRFCTMEMKQWEQIVRERPILRRIPDVRGVPMYTEERLFTYLQQFERDFAESPQRIFDCTEGGALKQGATPMPLSEALNRFCREPLRRGARKTAPGEPPMPERDADGWVRRSLLRRAEEAEEIQSVAGQTLPLLQDICDHLHDQPRVNRAIARIDLLRAKMNQYGETYDLVTHFTQSSELKRFEADLALTASGLDPAEKQRRQVQRDLLNCRAIGEAAGEFAGFVRGVVAEMPGASP